MLERQQQTVPVRIYQSRNQLALVAPVAGLEPEDITVSIDGKHVTIRGRERGPHQHDLDLLVAEWTFGPYYREVTLPHDVDGSLTNATYGNGVLVLTMPKAKPFQKGKPADFALERVEPTRGERVGHTGHDPRRATTKEHFQSVARLHRRGV
jgi:HSP20 family protein